MTASQVVQGVRELLGEEGFRKYIEFDRTASAQVFTEKIGSVLCFTGAPLTAGQADELMKILASSQVTRSAAKPRRFDWDTITAKAQGILSPPQLTALAGMRAEDEFQQAFNGFRASRSNPASTSGGSPAK